MARKMTVVCLAATKGGVGKTTLASTLAVRAAQESKKVALLDLDPQASLIAWWDRRGRKQNPKLFEMDATTEAIGLLLKEGWEWVFIDTSPAKLELVEPAIAESDFVLIPTRPSKLDIEQVGIPIEMADRYGKPYGFILNHAPASWEITKAAIAHLKKLGGDVIPHPIQFRQAYMTSISLGKTAPEVEKDGQASKEVDAIWKELKAIIKARVK